MNTHPAPSSRSLHALDWLNFFVADVQTGVGPFLAAALVTRRWKPQEIGVALTVAGLVGIFMQSPAGAAVDATRRKRTLIAACTAVISISALMLAFFNSFASVIFAQTLMGAVTPFLAPALAAITLGLVGRRMFDTRFGRNQGFNAAGNVFAALLMGWAGWALSPEAIFFCIPLLAVPSFLSLAAIRPDEIDYLRSRGARSDGEPGQIAGLRVLLKDRVLLAFAGCAILFHLSNAAMLPQLGEMLSRGRPRDASLFMSAAVAVTQLVIACTAAWVGRHAQKHGRKPLLLLGFGVLPLRGVLYTLTSSVPLLVSIQLLDGVANSIFGVVSTLVIADRTRGTGRMNLALGSFGMAVGIGASLSTTVAGAIAQRAGYGVSFLALAAIALVAVCLLWLLVPETRHEQNPDREGGGSMPFLPQLESH
ncbi:MAG TPA: MFS transporter [Bryobacteraceae bacterium]|jgi:MFS family permease|nr:MFS transporter [Bryobacteraceae bacterium]